MTPRSHRHPYASPDGLPVVRPGADCNEPRCVPLRSKRFVRVVTRTGRLAVLTLPLLMGACEQARALMPKSDEAPARYALERDDQGRVIRLDTVTGEMAVITQEESRVSTPARADRPRAAASARAVADASQFEERVAEDAVVEPVNARPALRVAPGVAPSVSAPPRAPVLTIGTRVTIVRPSPVYLSADDTRTPLEVLASGAVGRVMRTEGEWYLIEFQSPRWGRRVGYLKSTMVESGQQPLDLSVPESRLRPMDLSITNTALEPMDLSIPDSRPSPNTSPTNPKLEPQDLSIRDPLEPTDLSIRDPQ